MPYLTFFKQSDGMCTSEKAHYVMDSIPATILAPRLAQAEASVGEPCVPFVTNDDFPEPLSGLKAEIVDGQIIGVPSQIPVFTLTIGPADGQVVANGSATVEVTLSLENDQGQKVTGLDLDILVPFHFQAQKPADPIEGEAVLETFDFKRVPHFSGQLSYNFTTNRVGTWSVNGNELLVALLLKIPPALLVGKRLEVTGNIKITSTAP